MSVSTAANLAGVFLAVFLLVGYFFPQFPLLGPLAGAALLCGGIFLFQFGNEQRRQPSPPPEVAGLPISAKGLALTMRGIFHMIMGMMAVLLGGLLLVFGW